MPSKATSKHSSWQHCVLRPRAHHAHTRTRKLRTGNVRLPQRPTNALEITHMYTRAQRTRNKTIVKSTGLPETSNQHSAQQLTYSLRLELVHSSEIIHYIRSETLKTFASFERREYGHIHVLYPHFV